MKKETVHTTGFGRTTIKLKVKKHKGEEADVYWYSFHMETRPNTDTDVVTKVRINVVSITDLKQLARDLNTLADSMVESQ